MRIFIVGIGMLIAFRGDSQETIPLYEKIPNSKPIANREQHETREGILRISKVSIPTMDLYQPAKKCSTRAAVIICPGGGYGILAAAHEGADVAKLLNQWGITAVVLKYRLPDDSIMLDKSVGPLQDVQRAIQLVRRNANQWDIDGSKVGVMGFSAGGHLAATASTQLEAVIDNSLNVWLRPDFSVLIYPVISFADSITHMGSRNNLLGKTPSPAEVTKFSEELQVTTRTPLAFIVHASDDKSVVPANSILYYQALLRHNIKAELHLYQQGGHGFGMNNKTTTDKWTDRLKNWLQSNQIL